MKSRKKRLREVYVWELPVRIYHWVNALCIVILCVTGFIICRSSRDHVRFGGLFQLLVRRGFGYPFRNSVRILLQFRIPALLGIRRESLCQME